jgi:hypothetical protein
MYSLFSFLNAKWSPAADCDVCDPIDFPPHLPRIARLGDHRSKSLAVLVTGKEEVFGATPAGNPRQPGQRLDSFGLNLGGQLRHSSAGWQLPVAFAVTFDEPISHQPIHHALLLLPPPRLGDQINTVDQAEGQAALCKAWLNHVNERDWQLPVTLPASEGILIGIDKDGMPLAIQLMDIDDDPKDPSRSNRLLIAALRSLAPDALQTALPRLISNRFTAFNSSSKQPLYCGWWDADVFGQIRERWMQWLACTVPSYRDGTASLGPIETRLNESLHLARLWMLERLDVPTLAPFAGHGLEFDADRFIKMHRDQTAMAQRKTS